MTDLDCCVFAFSSPKSHLCLQEPNTPQSQRFALPKTHSTTRSKSAHSFARTRRGHAHFPARRGRLVAIRRMASKCSGDKRSRSRNAAPLAAGAGGQESITAIPLRLSRLWRSVLWSTRHHKLKRKSGLNMPSPTQGFPAPMDGAYGLPLCQ